MEFELLKILKLAIDLTVKMEVFNTLEDAKEWLYGDE